MLSTLSSWAASYLDLHGGAEHDVTEEISNAVLYLSDAWLGNRLVLQVATKELCDTITC